MRRREFFALFGAAALWPAAAHAQSTGKVHRVGFLGPPVNTIPNEFRAFHEELRQLGFAEGANLTIDHRPFNDPRGPAAAAADLNRANADVFVALGPEVTLQVLVGLGGTTPIVFIAVNYDPIERGYVANLARPAGNVTGIVSRQTELAAKQMEILAQAIPGRAHMGILWDAISANQASVAEKAAKAMQLEVHSLKLENPPYDFDAAFQTLAAAGAQNVVVLSSPHFIPGRSSMAQAALRHRLPTMFIAPRYVRAGGLMSYGVDAQWLLRRAAVYVAKILNGSKPGDLPIEQPREYQFVVNQRTAKALGVTIPESLLARADEVIE